MLTPGGIRHFLDSRSYASFTRWNISVARFTSSSPAARHAGRSGCHCRAARLYAALKSCWLNPGCSPNNWSAPASAPPVERGCGGGGGREGGGFACGGGGRGGGCFVGGGAWRPPMFRGAPASFGAAVASFGAASGEALAPPLRPACGVDGRGAAVEAARGSPAACWAPSSEKRCRLSAGFGYAAPGGLAGAAFHEPAGDRTPCAAGADDVPATLARDGPAVELAVRLPRSGAVSPRDAGLVGGAPLSRSVLSRTCGDGRSRSPGGLPIHPSIASLMTSLSSKPRVDGLVGCRGGLPTRACFGSFAVAWLARILAAI